MKHFGRSFSNKNRDGVHVTVGQRWRSMDKRRPARSCEVVKVEGGVATLQEYGRDRPSEGLLEALKSKHPYASTWQPGPVEVQISRLHSHSTGWRLLA